MCCCASRREKSMGARSRHSRLRRAVSAAARRVADVANVPAEHAKGEAGGVRGDERVQRVAQRAVPHRLLIVLVRCHCALWCEADFETEISLRLRSMKEKQ